MPTTPWPLVAVLAVAACSDKGDAGGGDTDTPTDAIPPMDYEPPMAYTPPMVPPHTAETGGTGTTGGSGTSPTPAVPIRP